MAELLQPTTGGTMGIATTLQTQPKRKNRWLFGIVDVASTNALPPRKSARPGLTFKEFEFQHISESIWYPLKAEWKTINLILYDTKCNENPVFDWLTEIYDPSEDSTPFDKVGNGDLLKDATLELYDGCGNLAESWTFESAYPQSIDWGELEMGNFDIVTVDLVLRYQRAYPN